MFMFFIPFTAALWRYVAFFALRCYKTRPCVFVTSALRRCVAEHVNQAYFKREKAITICNEVGVKLKRSFVVLWIWFGELTKKINFFISFLNVSPIIKLALQRCMPSKLIA